MSASVIDPRRPDPAILEALAGAKKNPKGAIFADDDLARRFIDRHPELRYEAAMGKWYGWDKTVWQPDEILAVFAIARAMLREEAAEAKGKMTADLKSARTVAAVERLARSDPRAAATTDQWDADDLLLNTPAGMIDLATGACQPHDPARYCTKLTAASAEGDCPRWRQFLHEVTGGDEDLSNFLRRMAGYAATGLIREHALFFLYGTGGNGKGVFLNTLVKLLKDYATVAPMEVFTESATDRHPTELAMLRLVRLVVSQETEEGRRWAESRIKAITGGDPISARFMRQDFFTFEPKFKLMVAGNHKPRLRNVDEAMRRRLHMVPFVVTIPAHKRDKDLAAKLQAEAGGIMAWIVAGAREYLEMGLAPPSSVTEATSDYFGAEDLFGQWLEDSTKRGPKLWGPSGMLFAAWKRYAEAANHRPGDQRAFANRMEGAGFEPGKSSAKGGRYWSGLELIHTEESDAGPHWADGYQ